MTHLYIIRHGAYLEDDNHPIRNPALSPDGVRQAERLRERLAATGEIKADTLLTSPLERARQTADILAPALGIPVTVEPDMEEWRNENESVTWDDCMAGMMACPPDQRPFYEPFPGGETWAQFIFRASNALNRVAEAHAGKTVVIIGHGGIVQASFLFFFGHSTLQIPKTAMDAGYTSITHWQKISGSSGDRWLLERHNDCAHLQDWAVFRR